MSMFSSQSPQPRREDITVDGRRYRRFVYDNAKSSVFTEMPSQTPYTFSRGEKAPKQQQRGGRATGRRPSDAKMPEFTGVDAQGKPLKDIDGIPIIEKKKGDEVVYTVTLAETPAVLLSSLDTLNIEYATFSSAKAVEGASDVTISAKTIGQLQQAHYVASHALEVAREKKGYTHFFCVPFANYAGEDNKGNKFTQCDTGKEITSKIGAFVATLPNVDPSLKLSYAMPLPKLHVTLFLLSLLSTKEINRCKQVLAEASALVYDTVGSTSVLLHLQGLGHFGKEDHADVLWLGMKEVGKPGLASITSNIPAVDGPQACPRLARAIGVLSAMLQKEGLLTPASAQKQRLGENGVNCGVAWHLTLMNTKYGYKNEKHERRDRDFRNKSNSNDETTSLDSNSNANSENSEKTDNSGKSHSRKMDLRSVLDNNRQFDVGIHRAPCIQLCRLNHQPWFPAIAPEMRPNGYYTIEATLPLP